jgi:lipoprotein NlpD
MLKHHLKISAAMLLLLLTACATKTPAPVVDRRPPASAAAAPSPTPLPATTAPSSATPPARTTNTPASTTAPATTAATPGASSTAPRTPDLGKTHTVQKGETLFGIAFQNSIDLRELALWNNIENPALIKVGDVIRLTPPVGLATALPSSTPTATPNTPPAATTTPALPSAASERPATNTATLKTEPRAGKVPYTDQALARATNEPAVPATTPVVPAALPPSASSPLPAVPYVPPAAATAPATTPVASGNNGNVDWQWPTKGSVLTTFTELNKGIDISGARGNAVVAAAPGTVIHTGAGIRGYGRLVIIKHANNFVSAYAHNDKIVVTEGQEVKRGQKIAEMGNSDAEQVKLHFEIRRQGKPIDPMTLLPKP